LSERKQRVKIDDTYSSWADILYGVPQGSILGPLLFNIFICDMFLFIDIDIASYADDNTPYVVDETITKVIDTLATSCNKMIEWFKYNKMKVNPDKFHLLLNSTLDSEIFINSVPIKNSNSEVLLGIEIDSKLSFDLHITNLCKKANQKLSALTRLSSFMTFDQRKLIFNAFIRSHFSYCPLVWMFHSRKLNNKINHLHERSLRIIFQDFHSTFEELLKKDQSVTIHQRNLQYLMIEFYKIINGLSPKLMSENFQISEKQYDLRKTLPLKEQKIRTVKYGSETVSFIGNRLWRDLPNNIKQCSSLSNFKKNIKTWVPKNCPCRLCKTFVKNLGFL